MSRFYPARSILLLPLLVLAVPVWGSPDVKSLPFARAEFVVPLAVVIPHVRDRVFIGPGTTQLPNGDILLLAPWGCAPATFEELRGVYPLPHFYRSTDQGRTWHEQDRIAMEWKVGGTTNNGGFGFLRLQDGRLVEYREFIDSFDAAEQALGRELQL